MDVLILLWFSVAHDVHLWPDKPQTCSTTGPPHCDRTGQGVTAELLPTVMKPTEVYCTQPKHETNKLDLYCNTCSSLTCNKCVLEYHKDHNITSLSFIAEAHRDERKGTYHSALGMMSTLAGAIEANKKMME